MRETGLQEHIRHTWSHKEAATQHRNGEVPQSPLPAIWLLVCARRTDRQRFLDCLQGFSSTLYPQLMESPQMLSFCCLLTHLDLLSICLPVHLSDPAPALPPMRLGLSLQFSSQTCHTQQRPSLFHFPPRSSEWLSYQHRRYLHFYQPTYNYF